jgi:hypothetical protein
MVSVKQAIRQSGLETSFSRWKREELATKRFLRLSSSTLVICLASCNNIGVHDSTGSLFGNRYLLCCLHIINVPCGNFRN